MLDLPSVMHWPPVFELLLCSVRPPLGLHHQTGFLLAPIQDGNT